VEQLPYIDEHCIQIAATPADVWDRLISVLGSQLRSLGSLAPLLGLSPAQARGDWRGAVGDALPGFEIVESEVPRRLALRGRHRFSRYALVFELDAISEQSCTLRAQGWAEFTSVLGRAFRALVIGTGGHRLAVRRMLRGIAERA
jgi:hypothetical protein